MDIAIGSPLGPHADPFAFNKPDAGDEQLMVLFFMGVVDDDAASAEAGRKVCRDVEFVKVIVPGDRNNIIERPASQHDKQRFAKQYLAFKAGLTEDQQITGTRLEDWTAMTRAQCEELKYLGIRTVEQVANCRDDVVMRVPGLLRLKQLAQVWLDKAQKTADATRIEKVVAGLQNENQTLKQALADQAARIEKLVAAAGVKV